jgi:predicted Ser/Thr protein kinase
MATAAQKRAEGDAKDAKDAIDKYLENWYNILLEEEKAKNSAAEKQKDRENTLKAAVIRANGKDSNNSGKHTDPEKTTIARIWKRLNPDAKKLTQKSEVKDTIYNRPMSTTEDVWNEYTLEESYGHGAMDEDTMWVFEMMKQGYSEDAAIEALMGENAE